MPRQRPAPLVATLLLLALPALAAASPDPLPPNPTVQALVAEVSTVHLEATLQALEGFHTRHSNSDTTSAIQGIGAARRHLHGLLEGYAAEPGSFLAPGYFDFTTWICQVNGLHRNVLAEQPGQAGPERRFVVASHLDSRTVFWCDATGFAPGVNDDGSGTAVVLEMARVMGATPLEATMVYLATTGEEQGLYGSRAWAEWAQDQGLRIDGMIADDTVGNITGCVDPACPPGEEVITDSLSVRHFSQGPSTSRHRQLSRAMKLNGERYLPDFTVNLIAARDRPGRSGDHFAFDERGYAAARFTEPHEFGDGSGANGHQHNGTDLLEFVHVPYVARIARLNVACFANLALAPESPGEPVADAGPGGVLLTWDSVASAPDLAGYRVALRGTEADSLFYFDIRDAGLDAGAQQSFIVDGLPPGVPLYLSVSAYDEDGNESVFGPEALATPLHTGAPLVPDGGRADLRVVEPNPSTGPVAVRFSLAREAALGLEVFDAGGRRVATVARGTWGAGDWTLTWDGRGAAGEALPAGVYLLRLSVSGEPVDALKLVRLR